MPLLSPCPQVAVRALQQLLSMGAAGGAPGLAAVCERLPEPSDEAIEEAGLPPMEGGWDASHQNELGGLWAGFGWEGSRWVCCQGRGLGSDACTCTLAINKCSRQGSCVPQPVIATYRPPTHPPAAGLSAAQRSVASRLPLLHEMFGCLTKPSCARELEAMCGCLSLAAEVLPPAFAGERLQ